MKHHRMHVRLSDRVIEVNVSLEQEISRLVLTVHPDLRITARAPHNIDADRIKARIQRRALWIEKQIRYFESFLPREPARRYISGESFRYLGRQYRLKIVQDTTSSAKLIGRYLLVTVPINAPAESIKQTVDEWYLKRCEKVFSSKLADCYSRSNAILKVELPPLHLRKMSRRWGSYTPGGKLFINPELIKTPLDCIEYVIMHELCHSRVKNHSPKFEQLLTRLMPDWQVRRDKLEKQQ